MHQKYLVRLWTKRKIEYFDLQQAFKMSYFAQISSTFGKLTNLASYQAERRINLSLNHSSQFIYS